MKKTLVACALLGSIAATSAHAATVVGFKVGGDYWEADAEGTFAQKGVAQQEFDYSSSSQGSVWVAIEHPIPLVPNFKIRENSLDADGKATLGGEWDFAGSQFNDDVTTVSNLSNTDFVLYWELLDNDIVALDLGAAYKKMHGSFRVHQVSPSGVVGAYSQKDLDDGVVMAYANAEVGIPGIGLYVFADVMQGIDESNVYDYQLGLGWAFDGTALDTKIRFGYRDFNFDVNDFDGVTANMQFKGYFAGLELVF